MKRILFAVILIGMFNFKTTTNANYEQTFFDFSIKSNTGEIINLNKYKNNVILIVNTASIAGLQNNTLICKNYGISIKKMD